MTTGTVHPSAFQIDLDLIRKYNRPGPRYTSYPTALHFSESVENNHLIEQAHAETGPISLYIHLPFCHSMCWFCGCTKIITHNQAKADRYIDYLEKEIKLFSQHMRGNRSVVQMHLGGGSPNFLSPPQINRLNTIIRRHFELEPDAEISVELDPRRLTQAHVEAFCSMGMNRASLGIQDCDPNIQQAIHRVQPSSMNEQAIGWLRHAGIQSLNIDLIYGLPLQTSASFAATLAECLSYSPERFAIFSYAHVPWSAPAQKILERNALPDADTKMHLLKSIVETLLTAGYQHIGMDHFAQPTDPLVLAQQNKTLQRNFQGYSTHADTEIIGFGMSSISQTHITYRQNIKDIHRYYAALDADQLPIERGYLLTQDDIIRRETIMRIMCDMELDFSAISRHFNIDFATYYAAELIHLTNLQEDGLIDIQDNNCLHVTEQGRFLIRNIAMHFDPYLQAANKRYSKTV